jgi:hypothetical protein
MDGAPPRTPSEQLAQHETLQHKPDRSLANKTGQIEKLTTLVWSFPAINIRFVPIAAGG